MTRPEKHNAELEWFDAIEHRANAQVKAYSDIDKLREGGRGHYKPKPSFVARILAFFA